MSRNINVFEADIIKDQFGVYPEGCTKAISCDAQFIKEEYISTEIYDPSCVTFITEGVAVDQFSPATSVLSVQVRDAQLGDIWIDKTSYDANHPDCNACCEPNQLATPANLVLTPGDGEVEIDFDAVTGASGYTILRGITPDVDDATELVVIEDYATEVPYTDSTVVNDTQYYYFIQATGPNKNPSSYAVGTATPTAP